jgi:hypothetical protein
MSYQNASKPTLKRSTVSNIRIAVTEGPRDRIWNRRNIRATIITIQASKTCTALVPTLLLVTLASMVSDHPLVPVTSIRLNKGLSEQPNICEDLNFVLACEVMDSPKFRLINTNEPLKSNTKVKK